MSEELGNNEVSIENTVIENQEENNSGQGAQSPVPDVVAKRFNWGAFGFSWIWCLVYKQYLWALVMFLIGFIPLVPLVFEIFLGIKGNSWAWKAKKYKSVKEFHKIHRIWACCELGYVLLIVFITVALMLPTLIKRMF